MSFEALSNSVDPTVEDREEASPKPGSWESRLEIARAKRAKVLAEQAAQPKQACAKKPAFLLDNIDLQAETAAFLLKDSNEETPGTAKLQDPETLPVDATVVAPPLAADPVFEAPAPPLSPAAPAKSDETQTIPAEIAAAQTPSRFGRLGFVVVAGFTGLGFGFALGLGLLIGAGWVSPQQFTSSGPAPLKTSTSLSTVSAAPAAMTNGPKAPALTETGPVITAIAPVAPAAAVASPSSGLSETAWANGLTIEPHAQLSMQPAEDLKTSIAWLETLEPSNPAARLSGYAPSGTVQPDALKDNVQQVSLTPARPAFAAPSTESGITKTAWVQNVTIEPHAKLPTNTQGDAALNLARFQMSETNNPASVLGAYVPPSIVGPAQTKAVQHLPGPDLQLASLGALEFQLPALPKEEVVFTAPSIETSQLWYQAGILNRAPMETSVPAPKLAAAWTSETRAAAFALPSQKLESDSFVLDAAIAPQKPIELTFAQSMGLSAAQAQNHSLTLLAPDTIKAADMDSFSAQLEETGLPLAKSLKVGFTISKPHIRFYSTDSKAVAVSLAERMGIEARDFTYAGRTSSGIEVWMAGKSSVPAAKPRKTTRRATTRKPVSDRTRLSNSIISGLRNATTE